MPEDKAGTSAINPVSLNRGCAKNPVQSSDSEEETEATPDAQSTKGDKDLCESRNTVEATKLNVYRRLTKTVKKRCELRNTPNIRHTKHVIDDGPPFVCDECGKAFAIKNRLEVHLHVHYKQTVFRCLVCKGTFLQQEELVRHLDKHIADSEDISLETDQKFGRPSNGHRLYRCGVCEKSFLRLDEVYVHIDEHIPEDSFDLKLTEDADIHVMDVKAILGSNELKSSLSRTSWKRIREPFIGVKCRTCGEEYNSRSSLQMHSCKVANKMCSICGITYGSVLACEMHLKTHFKIKLKAKEKFHCALCNRSYNGKAGLIEHNNGWHSEGPKYMCHICGKVHWFASRHHSHMRRHKDQTEGKREPQFKCKLCPKVFMRDFSLKKHVLQHQSVKSTHSCATCSKEFNTISKLKTHAQVHTGDKPFSCIVCSRAFKRQNHLDVHMRLHTGEKPHKCAICDKAFAQQAGLSGHMKTHEEKKKRLISDNE